MTGGQPNEGRKRDQLMEHNQMIDDKARFMKEALIEAVKAREEGEIPIGAVIVCDCSIIGRGHARHKQEQNKAMHAEMVAITDASKAILKCHGRGCTIYSTVEPCVMCLGATVMSDIRNIVFGLPDHWIEPRLLLSQPYISRHIESYTGGVLESECAGLFMSGWENDLQMLLTGTRKRT